MSIVFILIIIYFWKLDSNWELATITIYLVNWINKCALTKYTTEKIFLFLQWIIIIELSNQFYNKYTLNETIFNDINLFFFLSYSDNSSKNDNQRKNVK